jgi:glutamate carboxypeptidase
VWPLGTLADWPLSITDGRATGPGIFDMKLGVVQMLAALSRLPDLDGVCVLLTGDEEIGSPSSRTLIESSARGTQATFVLEPGIEGRLKTARKGVSGYTLAVTGRAAHAGLEPEKGINAAVELAHLTAFAATLGDHAEQTTVTPSGLRAGTAANVVPAAGELDLDVRAWTAAEQQRVDDALRRRRPVVPDATIDVRGGINRPPLEEVMSRDLFALASDVARDLGMPALQGERVGGASDGNFTAAVGSPTLDGLGAVGAGAHAAGEWADLTAAEERTALLSGLVERVLTTRSVSA